MTDDEFFSCSGGVAEDERPDGVRCTVRGSVGVIGLG